MPPTEQETSRSILCPQMRTPPRRSKLPLLENQPPLLRRHHSKTEITEERTLISFHPEDTPSFPCDFFNPHLIETKNDVHGLKGLKPRKFVTSIHHCDNIVLDSKPPSPTTTTRDDELFRPSSPFLNSAVTSTSESINTRRNFLTRGHEPLSVHPGYTSTAGSYTVATSSEPSYKNPPNFTRNSTMITNTSWSPNLVMSAFERAARPPSLSERNQENKASKH